MHECRELKQYFKKVEIMAIRRHDNQVADAIAKHRDFGNRCIENISMNVVRLIPIIPSYCHELLSLDCKRLFGHNSLI